MQSLPVVPPSRPFHYLRLSPPLPFSHEAHPFGIQKRPGIMAVLVIERSHAIELRLCEEAVMEVGGRERAVDKAGVWP